MSLSISPILIQKNPKPNCTNSVYFETSSLKLLCAINGPYYSSSSQKNADESKMDISISLKIPNYITHKQKESAVNYNESQINEILNKHFLIEKYPRTKLDVIIEIFEFNCDYLPYAIMATSLCACYANIEQKGILSCCNLIIDRDNNIIVDPSLQQEQHYKTKFIFGCNLPLEENFIFTQIGYCEHETLKQSIAIAIKICELYHKYLISKL